MKNITKRALHLLTVVAFVVSLLGPLTVYMPKASAFTGAGDGSETYPYRITTCEEVQDIQSDTTAHYVMMNDIFCSDSFTPITDFSGSLDGRNNVLYNISINLPSVSDVGMFAQINGGTVKNIILGNAYINGNENVGTLAGEISNNAVVDHVAAIANVTGNSFVGGLIGTLSGPPGGTVTNSSAKGTVTATADGNIRVGGLVGDMDYGQITDSYADEAIAAGTTSSVGGLVGFMFTDTSITRSYASGSITGGTTVGGLVGFVWDTAESALISDSFSVVSMSGGGDEIGGLVGRNYGGGNNLTNNFFDASATGRVTGSRWCDAYSVIPGCTELNVDGSDGDHFKNTSNIAPMTTGSWDFPGDWFATEDYPILLSVTSLDTLADVPVANTPTNLSASATSASVIHLSWTAPVANGGGTTTDYVVEYKLSSDTDWTTFSHDASGTVGIDVTDLTPDTAYDFRISAVNAGGQSESSDTASATTEQVSSTINSCDDLQNIQYNLVAHYTLASNIDCSDTVNWNDGDGFEPIDGFSGNLDGAGFTIEGLHINRPLENNVGIFGSITGGSVVSLTLNDSSVVGGDSVGTIVGEIDAGTISHVTIGVDEPGTVSGSEDVGGIAGKIAVSDDATVVLSSLVNHGSVSGESGAGGLVGEADVSDAALLSVSESVATGNVETISGGAGGLIGTIDGSPNGVTVSESYASGNVTAGGSTAGGLIGSATSQIVLDSYATGNVSGMNEVGGLIGFSTSNVSNTYATGAVTATNDYVGGLIGKQDDGTITDSFAVGHVADDNGGEISMGGLIGLLNDTDGGGTAIDNVYYALDGTGSAFCVGSGDDSECQPALINGEDPNPFFFAVNEPLASWDFGGTWASHDDAYPTFLRYETGNSPTIHTCSQLQAITDNVAGTYTLANDIDCSDTENWNDGEGFVPIADFSGTLDGAGHTITGLTINRPDDSFQALFASVSNGVIHHISLSGASITGSLAVGVLVAGISGEGATIDDVTINGDITAQTAAGLVAGGINTRGSSQGVSITHTSTSGSVNVLDEDSGAAYLGGLVGALQGPITFTNNSSSADINGTTDTYLIGGLIGSAEIYGENSVNMRDLSYTGDVNGGNSVGGLIGTVAVYAQGLANPHQLSITRATVSGNVTGVYDIGGLIGSAEASDSARLALSGVSTSGNVTGSSNNIGGLIGTIDADMNTVSIRQSFTTGQVAGSEDYVSSVGGLVGYSYSPFYAIDTYTTGAVLGGTNVGGLLGRGQASVSTSYSASHITGTLDAGHNIGGLVGRLDVGSVTGSFSTGLISGPAHDDTYIAGLIGSYDASGVVLSNNYVDRSVSDQPYCSLYTSDDISIANNTNGECQLVDGEDSQPDYFLDNTSAAPLNQWNFDDIWQTNTGDLPTFQGFVGADAPDAPTDLVGTGDRGHFHLSWTAPTDDGGSPIVGYLVQYRGGDDDDWSGTGLVAGTSVDIAADNLSDWSNYSFRVTTITEADQSDPSEVMTYSFGTDHDISSCQDLQNIDNDLTGSYTLTKDIDCSGTTSWNGGAGFSPIGMVDGDAFTGSLDGQGYNIIGLFEDRTNIDGDPSVGLFYWANGAVLTNFSLRGGSMSGQGNGGAIAANANDTVASKLSSDTAISMAGGGDVGGLFGGFWSSGDGFAMGRLSDSFATGDIEGSEYIGGLMGYAQNITILDTYYNGTLSNSDSFTGGLVGHANDAISITNSYAAGSVTSDGSYAGGLVGYLNVDGAVIKNSFSANSVTAIGDPSTAGGIAGGSRTTLLNIDRDYYDAGRDGLEHCIGDGSDDYEGCAPVNADNDEPNYFLGNSSHEPMNQWDFENTWVTGEGSYPTLSGFNYTPPDNIAITDCEGLEDINNDLTAHYTLANDIDCSDTMNWNGGGGFIPIAAFDMSGFTGRLDGQGHAITGLYMNWPDAPFLGLFIAVNGGQISNLSLSGFVSGSAGVGALAGIIYGGAEITNVVSNATVSGQNDGTNIIGDVLGVGGLVGYMQDTSTISKSSSAGTVMVTSIDNNNIAGGGLVGQMDGGTVADSYATATVSGTDGTVSNGGLVGVMYEQDSDHPPVVEKSYATGSVSAGDNGFVGGLVGSMFGGVLAHSFSAGEVAVGADGMMGGLIGLNSASLVLNNYFDVLRSGTANCDSDGDTEGCTAVNTNGNPQPNFFFGSDSRGPLGFWNFDDTWHVNSNSYPTFQYLDGPSDSVVPTTISTCEQLQAINDDLSGDYVLANDIDCSDTVNWNEGAGFSPIGFDDDSFTGSFDGQGYRIIGLTINMPDTSDIGLFSSLAEDASVVNVVFDGGSIAGFTDVGSVAGDVYDDTVLQQVASNLPVTGNTEVGGLVGHLANDSSITDSYTTGAVNAIHGTGGGLIGLMTNNAAIANSYATGDITSLGDEGTHFNSGFVGGLVGFAYSGTIRDSFATGRTIVPEDRPFFGNGLVGEDLTNGDGLTNDHYNSDNADYCGDGDIDYFITDECTGVSLTDQPNYFFNNNRSAPLDQWDFETIWVSHLNTYPTFSELPFTDLGTNAVPTNTAKTPPAKIVAKSRLAIVDSSSSDQDQHAVATSEASINLDDFTDYTNGNGKKLMLQVGDVIHFTLNRHGTIEQHTATVKEVGDGYVILTIASTPFDIRLNVGQTRVVSIAGSTAIKIGLVSTAGGRATLLFSKVGAVTKGSVQEHKTHSYQSALLYIVVAAIMITFFIVLKRHRRGRHEKK